MTVTRCAWVGSDPLNVTYHDTEWGVPVHDDRLLFEFLVLEGAQAGLSWSTILRKRNHYRQAFEGFDLQRVAAYGETDIERLLHDAGIVRNRRKVEAAIHNARAALAIQEEFGSLGSYLWGFVGGRTIHNAWRSIAEVPTSSPASLAMSAALKHRGCSFVGPTIAYAFMQAVGMVNDHTIDCFRHTELRRVIRLVDPPSTEPEYGEMSLRPPQPSGTVDGNSPRQTNSWRIGWIVTSRTTASCGTRGRSFTHRRSPPATTCLRSVPAHRA